jgi:hypothetical protein
MTQYPDITNNLINENRVTVMSKSGFLPEPKANYAGDVLAILISIVLIIGGASGTMVLRGTDSSPALVLVGFLFLAWDIFSIFKKNSNLRKAQEEQHARRTRMFEQENMVKEDGRALPSPVNVRIVCDKNLTALDYGPRLNGNVMTRDAKLGEYTGIVWYKRNILNFNNLDLTVIFDIDANTSEIVMQLFRDKADIGIDLPGDLTVIPDENTQIVQPQV